MTELSQIEKKSICQRLQKYSPAADPNEARWFWDDYGGDICGKFVVPNRIVLRDDWKSVLLEDKVADDVLCHELWHFGQYRKQGWIRYAVMNLTRLNEKSAYVEQERVRRIIEG